MVPIPLWRQSNLQTTTHIDIHTMYVLARWWSLYRSIVQQKCNGVGQKQITLLLRYQIVTNNNNKKKGRNLLMIYLSAGNTVDARLGTDRYSRYYSHPRLQIPPITPDSYP